MARVTEKISSLERALEKLAALHQKTQENIDRLSEEMREFKDEMREFKEWSKQNIAELRKISRKLQEDTEEFKKEMQEFKEWSKQNIAEIRENSKRFEEWAKQNIRDLNKKWGELANRLGTVVEDIIAPGLLEASKKYFGCDEEPDDFMVRRRKKNLKDRSKVREFDLIIVCGDNVIINETKTTPKPEYVEAFHKFIRSGEIFEYFPEFKGKRIIPVFSSLNMPDDIVNLLTKKGIYAATMKGDYIDLVNFERL